LRIRRVQIPELPLWENLEAGTRYANRNLLIRDLTLSPELVFEEINFDASQRAQDKGRMFLKSRVFGGRAELSLAGSQLKKKGENLEQSYQTTLELKAQEISLEAAAAYFGVKKPPVARLDDLTVTFRGEPEKPRTWQGGIAARLETLGFDKMKVDSLDLNFIARDGTGQITAANVGLGRNNVRLTATIGLPESVNDFPKSDIDAQLAIEAPELAAITGMFGEPIAGAASGNATVSLQQSRLHLTAQINALQLAGRGLSVESAKVDLDATKRLDQLEAPPWQGAENRVTAEIKGATFQSFQLDSLRLDAGSRNEVVNLNAFEVRRAENMVTARGNVRLPEDPAKIVDAPADVHLEINIPRLDQFGVKAGNEILGGRVTGRGDFQLGPSRGGTLRIESDGLSVGAFQARRFETALRLTENVAVLEQLALELDEKNRIVASGNVGVAKPMRYEAALTVELPDVAALQPLLAAFGQSARVDGAIHLGWKGAGDVQPAAHSGQLELTAGDVRYDKVELSSARLAGSYGPGWAESTEFRLATGETAIAGTLAYGEGYFRTSELVLQQGQQRVLTGHVILPLNPEKPDAMVPLDGVIKASISADNLDLQKLLASFGQKSPVTGVFSSNLLASGTLLQPVVHLSLAARDFKSAKFAKMDAAAIDLAVHYEQAALSVDTTIRQREIQPLTLHA
ncbi:MAG: hypothetical protein M3463_23630, partial [Verrucomicrobiota bacterium]|nr:hypothetical protein [Verrucomicrobiota bacterium]